MFRTRREDFFDCRRAPATRATNQAAGVGLGRAGSDLFRFPIEAGFLLPGEALRYLSPKGSANNRDPSFAFSIQSRLTLQF